MGIITYKIGSNGRFANAIFQACSTMAVALDRNAEFVFPEWSYRKWFLQELPLGNPQIDIRIPVEFHYAPIPDYPNKNTELFNGHMQSWRYFAHRWKDIEPYFTLKSEYELSIALKYSTCLNHNKTCGIHVRRTDYTTPVNLDFHGAMSKEYYEEGAEQIYGTKKPKDVLFIICSDDIAWCKENFSFPNQVFIEREKDVIDMFILRYCKDLIIANSSFSLFPAVVKTITEKECKIVAPKQWFQKNASHIITKDIYMPEWVLL